MKQTSTLTAEERQQIFDEWNDTKQDYPRDRYIHELFEGQVNRSPDAIAVVFNQQEISYIELNRRANQLAHRLKRLGVGTDILVATCLNRSLEMVIALLGILKAGGAYLPLDPAHPSERLSLLLEESRATTIVTCEEFRALLPESSIKICLDSEWNSIALEMRDNLDLDTDSENLAYVMYTSGSTGTPKGVAVPHRAVVRLVCETNYIRFEPDDCVAQIANCAFDASTFEIWGALLHGSRLVIIPKEVVLSPNDFVDRIVNSKINILFLTTSLFHFIAREAPNAFQSVRSLLVGGEQLEPRWVRKVLEGTPPERLINAYGPTEATTFATWYQVKDLADTVTNIPIGKPLSNTEVYILDEQLQPVPVGVSGELYIGGDALAKGYLHDPNSTASRFLVHPFSPNPKARIYKSGDLAQWLPDGNIEFLGRLDEQVKIRGFRVEPGEVEAVLNQYSEVAESVVLMDQSYSVEKHLIAYVVSRNHFQPTTEALRSYLKNKLPDYSIPTAFVFLNAFPLTPSGKLDRRALKQLKPERRQLDTQNAVSVDPIVVQLREVWKKVLKMENVGLTDNFFDLGGHSLLGLHLVAEVQSVTGQDMPISALFQAPTIEGLARLLRQKSMSQDWSSLIPIQTGGDKPPIFCIHNLGGDVLPYRTLAKRLGPDQPLYGLESRGLNGKMTPLWKIEDMAASYVNEIRKVQPNGPYSLTGVCIGGVIALETAQQLQKDGQSIALLALIDSHASRWTYPRSKIWAMTKYVCQLFYGLLFKPQKRNYLRLIVKFFKSNIGYVMLPIIFRFASARWSSLTWRIRTIRLINNRALKNYTPSYFNGKITLIRRTEESSQYSDNGWTPFCKNLEIFHSPGNHKTMMKAQNIGELARVISNCLKNAGTSNLKTCL